MGGFFLEVDALSRTNSQWGSFPSHLKADQKHISNPYLLSVQAISRIILGTS